MKTKRFASAGALASPAILAVMVLALSAALAIAGCGDSGSGDNSSPDGDGKIRIDFASAGANKVSFTLSRGTWNASAIPNSTV
jgi:hypothetical protein